MNVFVRYVNILTLTDDLYCKAKCQIVENSVWHVRERCIYNYDLLRYVR